MTYKEIGKPGEHDKVSLPLGFDKKTSEEGKFEVSLKSKSCLLLKHLSSGLSSHFLAASSSLKPHGGKAVTQVPMLILLYNCPDCVLACQVSVGSGGLGVSCAASSSSVLVWESSSGTVR